MELSQATWKSGGRANSEASPAQKSKYSIVVYNAEAIHSFDCSNIDELLKQVDPACVNWITVRDVHDEGEMAKLLAYFNLGRFLLDDILDEGRVEFESEYDNCLYLEYMVPYLDEERRELVESKGSFILTTNALILYEHQLHSLFTLTRRRALNRQTKIMQYGSDYLLYMLLRAVVVEHYQHGFKHITLQLEALEDVVLEGKGRDEFYRAILAAREGIKPWNEPLLELEEFLEYVKDAESKFISDKVAGYFAKSLLREVESLLNYYDRLRGMLREVMDLHMEAVGRNTARVNQLLTVIATVFLPITFIASIYGMNFDYMPELRQPWGYPAALILMAVVALGLIIFMRRRRWF
jgi:magnesium transporter